MLRIDGGGGGGHFVGLSPPAASGLARSASAAADRAGAAAAVVSGLLAEAAGDAGGVATPSLLRRVARSLHEGAEDLRWRVAVLAGDNAAAGMVFGVLRFGSADEAAADGRRFARLIEDALDRHVYGPDDGQAEALEDYLRLLRAAGVQAGDPAWSGGLLTGLGAGGLSNSLFFAGFEVEGDVDRLREITGPLFTAVATAMRHRTAPPQLRRELLRWPTYDLALVLALAPAETGFLTAAARRILVDSQHSLDRADDPNEREYVFVLEALADNDEAAFRVLTGRGRYGERNVVHLLRPLELLTSGDASGALARVLDGGLVRHPAGLGPGEWNLATATTEDVIAIVADLGYVMDEVSPDLNAALAGLLRPHLDAVAAIGARANGLESPVPLDVALPGGRRRLDVDAEALQDYLGAVLQQDSGVAQVQLMLAAASQRGDVQRHRLPLLDDEPVSHLDPFIGDSLRIAGLVGLVGHGLDRAGKDEEGVTNLLTGALNLAAGQGAAKLIPASRHPALWLAQRGVRYLAGEKIEEFDRWLQTREPIEGEAGVDAFLDAYVDTTEASLREHIADDPRLAALPAAERDALLRRSRFWVETTVGGALRETYADLRVETAKE